MATADWSPDSGADDVPDTSMWGVFGVSPAEAGMRVTRAPGRPGPNVTGRQSYEYAHYGDPRPHGKPPIQSTVGETLASYYSMTRDQRAELQSKLYQGGFYSNNKRPALGPADDDGYDAFHRAIITAVRSNKPISSLIDETITDRSTSGSQQVSDVVGGSVGGGANYVVRLDDPAQIAALADKIGQVVLGKKLTAKKKQQIVAAIQGQQASNQQAVNNAAEAQNQTQFAAQTSAAATKAYAAQGGAAPAASGALSPEQIAQVAMQAGFTGEALVTAVAVGLAESGGRPGAVGDKNLTTGGEQSTGIWQVNFRPARDRGNPVRDPVANADPVTNAQNAFQISGGGRNFKPWTTYNTGAYRSHLAKAQAAVQAVASGRGGAPMAPSAAGAADQSGIVSLSNTYIPAVTTTVTEVDPQARIEEMLRQEQPAEARAHDLTSAYDMFTKLLAGVGGQG